MKEDFPDPVGTRDADEAIRQLSKKYHSWNECVGKWRELAQEITQGYRLNIYDYINDISVRDTLEKALTSLPKNLEAQLGAEMSEADRVFTSATQSVPEPLTKKMFEPKLDSVPNDTFKWWWFRVPKKLTGELKEDVEEWYGMVDESGGDQKQLQ